MKRLFTIIIMAVVMALGCNGSLTPTASLMTGSNIQLEENTIEYTGRLGVQADMTNFGLASTWLDNTEHNEQTFGIYATQELMNDPNIPLVGRLYIGGQVTCDFDSDGGRYGPFLGVINELGGVEINTEFSYFHYNDVWAELQGDSRDQWKVTVGPKIYFPLE